MPPHHRLCPVLLILALSYVSARTYRPEVQTPAGTFRGQILTSDTGHQYAAYRGIPYAVPPTGNRRFAVPVPFPAMEGVYDAGQFGSMCPQYNDGNPIGHEDCLFLNVYTPLQPQDTQPADPKKVLVFIHGGGFTMGSANPYIPGDLVTRGDLIVVTMNYRIQWLGFLRGNSTSLPGNQGHWDQLLALRWVKDNIRAFGGDHEDITLSGESSGSFSVSTLAVSPLCKNLFTKAILFSGSSSFFHTPPRTTNNFLQAAVLKFGCRLDLVDGNEDAIAECLKKVPAERFVTEFGFDTLRGVTSWGDDLLPIDFQEILTNSEYLSEVGFFNRDYLVSNTKDEGFILTDARFGKADTSSLESAVKGISMFLPLTRGVIKRIVDEYSRLTDNLHRLVNFLVGDATFLKSGLLFIEAFSRYLQDGQTARKNAYFLTFEHAPRYVPNQYMLHVLDMAYLFDLNVKEILESFYYMEIEDEFDQEDYKLKADYIDLIVDFIHTGKPGTRLTKREGIVWHPYDTEKKSYLNFTLTPSVGQDAFGSRRYIWETLLPQWLQEEQLSGGHGEL